MSTHTIIDRLCCGGCRQSEQHLAKVEADSSGSQLCDQNKPYPNDQPVNVSAAEAPTSATGGRAAKKCTGARRQTSAWTHIWLTARARTGRSTHTHTHAHAHALEPQSTRLPTPWQRRAAGRRQLAQCRR